MYSRVCTLEARCVYSGGRQCTSGGRWNLCGVLRGQKQLDCQAVRQ